MSCQGHVEGGRAALCSPAHVHAGHTAAGPQTTFPSADAALRKHCKLLQPPPGSVRSLRYAPIACLLLPPPPWPLPSAPPLGAGSQEPAPHTQETWEMSSGEPLDAHGAPAPCGSPLGQQTPPWAMGPRPTLCRGKIRTRPVSLPFREKTQMTREKGHNYRLSHVLGRKCKERCPRTDVGAQRPQAVTHGRWKLRATQKPVMAPRSTGAECRSVSLFLLRTPCQWPAHTQASLKQLLSTAATGRCFLAPLTD